jgi:hypothetical protein
MRSLGHVNYWPIVYMLIGFFVFCIGGMIVRSYYRPAPQTMHFIETFDDLSAHTESRVRANEKRRETLADEETRLQRMLDSNRRQRIQTDGMLEVLSSRRVALESHRAGGGDEDGTVELIELLTARGGGGGGDSPRQWAPPPSALPSSMLQRVAPAAPSPPSSSSSSSRGGGGGGGRNHGRDGGGFGSRGRGKDVGGFGSKGRDVTSRLSQLGYLDSLNAREAVALREWVAARLAADGHGVNGDVDGGGGGGGGGGSAKRGRLASRASTEKRIKQQIRSVRHKQRRRRKAVVRRQQGGFSAAAAVAADDDGHDVGVGVDTDATGGATYVTVLAAASESEAFPPAHSNTSTHGGGVDRRGGGGDGGANGRGGGGGGGANDMLFTPSVRRVRFVTDDVDNDGGGVDRGVRVDPVFNDVDDDDDCYNYSGGSGGEHLDIDVDVEDTFARRISDLHSAPRRGLHSAPRRGLHSAPRRGLHSAPRRDLHSAPRRDLHSAPRRGRRGGDELIKPLARGSNEVLTAAAAARRQTRTRGVAGTPTFVPSLRLDTL